MLNDFLQPGLILIIAGLILLVIPERLKNIKKAVILLAPIISVVAVCVYDLGDTTQDRLTFFIALTFAVISVVAAFYNADVDDKYESAAEAVYAGASISVVFAQYWIGLLIFWDLMAVASWLIILSSRTGRAKKAGFRYLLMHMLGGNFLLVGIAMKIAVGETLITSLTGTQDVAFWFILIGVALNAAVPPLNAWIADAYPESTPGGTVYMASFTTKAAVFYLIRLFAGTEFLLYFGVFMAVWAACMALIENDLRRLLSYHIVSQIGYMVAALAVGGEMGIDGAAMHLVNNIFYKGTLMMCAGTVISVTGKRKISELSGIAKKMPLTAGCFLIASFAIAGFPLFNGFISKSLVMNAVAESGNTWAELLLMLASVGTLLSITLKINYFVFFGKNEGIEPVEADEKTVPLLRKVAMVAGATVCVITGVVPGILVSLTPYQTDPAAFTVDHVTQYVELFAAAAIAFVMYIDNMAPHEKITLDTDWFYRKPLKVAINFLSNKAEEWRLSLGGAFGRFFAAANRVLHNPRLLVTSEPKPRKNGLEDDDVLQTPIGMLLALNFVVFAFIVLVVVMKI